MAKPGVNHVVTDARESFGKGAARKLRALGKIPAVIYGHGTDPIHVALPGHEIGLILRKSNQILDLDINGKSQLALVKDVQKDPVRQIIEHIDLVVIRKGEKVIVDVPIHITGESAPGTLANLDAPTVSVEAEATHIPEYFTVDIEGLEDGQHIYAKDVTLVEGSNLLSDPELLVIAVSTPRAAADAAEGDAAEGEATEAASAEAAE
ncbi:50S ribosomal protein L25/general stress protein Ctc [Salinibacterium sp. SWN1162]|uniref:50S ribosomal protein L25/general stress protein Ctc n=1 Tax=Salinibacterium sp. SWN1162 TaxID=2792053 RepID=UPI0018CFD74A|nr:50S ribosomal protein L25/general stress protein Ctc [Salinibacterium sp. SWN1162]MBH0010180.1 50S ribosomal protein L25/general stress protein Ctc [Salinibacterium sp. SWN1162]